MDTAETRVKQVQHESERLKEYLSALPPDAWSRQSACERWQVGDVVAHLASGAEFYDGSITRGLRGETAPPEGFPPPGAADPDVVGEVIAQSAISVRDSLGDGLFSRFSSANDQLNRLLGGLGPKDWDQPCYHPASVFLVRTFLNLRMFELALHGWDIRSRLDAPAHLSAESIPILMEFISAMCGRLIQPTSDLPTSARYRFHLTGTASGDYDIVLEGGGTRMEPGGMAPADAAFQSDTETFSLLMTGRLMFEAATDEGRLVVVDESGLAPDFGHWFKGIWRPSGE